MKWGLLIGVLVLALLVVGCSADPAVCGNEVVDSGEECDVTGCSEGFICNNACSCEDLPLPPSFE